MKRILWKYILGFLLSISIANTQEFVNNFGDPFLKDEFPESLDRGKNKNTYHLPISSTRDPFGLFINSSSGNLFIDLPILEFPYINTNYKLKLLYSSSSTFNSRVGFGWSASFFQRYITNNINDNVIFYDENDKGYLFEKNGDKFNSQETPDSIYKIQNGFIYYQKDLSGEGNHIKKYFDSQSHYYITKEEDKHKNTIKYFYNNQHQLDSIKFTNRQLIIFNYKNDLLSSVIFGTDTIAKLIYENSVLETIYINGNKFNFSYSEDCKKITNFQFNDSLKYHFLYNDGQSNLQEISLPDNSIIQLSKENTGQTIITLPNQLNWTFYSDSLLRTTKILSPDNQKFQFNYNHKSQLVEFINSENNSIEYERNPFGLIEKVKNFNGDSKSYNFKDNILTEFTDYNQNQFTIKRSNNSKEIMLPNKHTLNFLYHDFGGLSSFSIDTIKKADFYYDYFGNIKSIKLPESIFLSFIYDNYGKIINFEDPNSNQYKFEYFNSQLNHINFSNQGYIEFIYDSLGRYIKGDLNGIELQTVQYDLLGRIIEIKSNHISKINYKDFDFQIYSTISGQIKGNLNNNYQIATIIFPDQSKTTYTYTALNQMKEEIISKEFFSSFQYDKLGNIIERKGYAPYTANYDNNGNLKKINYPELSILYSYNQLNEVQEVNFGDLKLQIDRDNMGYPIKYLFGKTNYSLNRDLVGRIKSENYIGANSKEFEYDRNSNVISETINKTSSIFYKYNIFNKLKEKNLYNQFHYIFHYDSLNQLTAVAINDEITTRLQYNDANRIIIIDDMKQRYGIGYDSLFYFKSFFKNDSKLFTFYYNSNQNINKITDDYNASSKYEYKNGFLNKTNGIFGGEIRTFRTNAKLNLIYNNYEVSLNSIGNKIESISDNNLHKTSFNYLNGFLSKLTNAEGNQTIYSHNYGNLEKIQETNGFKKYFQYNVSNQIERFWTNRKDSFDIKYGMNNNIIQLSRGNIYKKFTWNANNQLIGFSNSSGIRFTYEYDLYNRLILQTDNSTFYINYSYKDGNLHRIFTPTDTILYCYYNLNKLDSIKYLSNIIKLNRDIYGNILFLEKNKFNKNTFSYISNNIMNLRLDANNNEQNFEFDNLGRVVEFNIGSIKRNKYKYDDYSNITELINIFDGVFKYKFNKINRLKSFHLTPNDSILYTYKMNILPEKITYSITNGNDFFYDSTGLLKAINMNDIHYQIIRNKLSTKIVSNYGDTLNYIYDINGRITNVENNTFQKRKGFQYNSLGEHINWNDTLITRDHIGKIVSLKHKYNEFDLAFNNCNVSQYINRKAQNSLYDYTIIYNNRKQISNIFKKNDSLLKLDYSVNGKIASLRIPGNTIYLTYNLFGSITSKKQNNIDLFFANYGVENKLKHIITNQSMNYSYNYNKTLSLKSIEYLIDSSLFIYDSEGRLLKENFDGRLFNQFLYNRNNTIDSIFGKSFAVKYTNSQNGLNISNNHDNYKTNILKIGIKLIITNTFSNNTIPITFSFNKDGILKSINSDDYNISYSDTNDSLKLNSVTKTIKYDSLGNINHIIFSNGINIKRFFVGNQLEKEEIYNESILKNTIKYQYDKSGKISKISGLNNIEFKYDIFGNRISEKFLQNEFNYSFSPYGDIKSIESNQNKIFFKYNVNDILEKINNDTITYDKSGNLINIKNDTANTEILYNSNNQPLIIKKHNREISLKMSEQGLLQSIDSLVFYNNVPKFTNYSIPEGKPLQIFNREGKRLYNFFYGMEKNNENYLLQAIEDSLGTIYFYHYAPNGDLLFLTSSEGEIFDNVNKNYYGKIVDTLNKLPLFTLGEYPIDDEFSIRNGRLYSNNIGRYFSKAQDGYSTHTNLYAYQPVNHKLSSYNYFKTIPQEHIIIPDFQTENIDKITSEEIIEQELHKVLYRPFNNFKTFNLKLYSETYPYYQPEVKLPNTFRMPKIERYELIPKLPDVMFNQYLYENCVDNSLIKTINPIVKDPNKLLYTKNILQFIFGSSNPTVKYIEKISDFLDIDKIQDTIPFPNIRIHPELDFVKLVQNYSSNNFDNTYIKSFRNHQEINNDLSELHKLISFDYEIVHEDLNSGKQSVFCPEYQIYNPDISAYTNTNLHPFYSLTNRINSDNYQSILNRISNNNPYQYSPELWNYKPIEIILPQPIYQNYQVPPYNMKKKYLSTDILIQNN